MLPNWSIFLSVTINQHGRPMGGYPPPLPPHQKKRGKGQHGRPMTGLLYCTTQVTRCMASPSSLDVSGVFAVFCWGWGSSIVSVFGGSRLGRCQSTSRHGTCRYYAQSARWCTDSSSEQPTTCHHLVLAVQLTQPCRHIRNGTSCAAPHG